MSRFAGRLRRGAGHVTIMPVGESILGVAASSFRACALRKINTAYTGAAIKVRRSSDNALQDIGFSGNDLDTAALTAFVGSGNGYVHTWYDQSGLGRHLIQTIAASQGRIVNNGTIDTINAIPAIVFDGVDDYYSDSSVGLYAAGSSTFAAILRAATPSAAMHIANESNSTKSSGASSYRLLRSNSSTLMYQIVNDAYTSILASSSGAVFDNTPHVAYTCDDGALVTSFVDGTQGLNASYSRSGSTLTPNNFTLGATVQTTIYGYYAGSMSEFAVWPSALTESDRTTGQNNQTAYLSSTPGGGSETAPKAGALPLGLANYAAPGNALYVSLSGNDSNPGTITSPKKTVTSAIAAAAAGGTIVVRGGVYEQTLSQVTKAVTIQNYPGEAVWFDGTSVVTGWTNNGDGTWSKSGMSAANFDHSVPTGTTELDRYRDALTEPMFEYPEMVWVDGVRLKRSTTPPTSASQFMWDYNASVITIYGDPAGKEVRVSTQNKFVIASAALTVRGIGIRRYATGLAWAGAFNIVMAGSGTSLENCHIVQNGLQGLCPSSLNVTIHQCTIAQNGNNGIGGNKSGNLRITNCLIEGNNVKLLKSAPISANVKLTVTSDVLVKDCIVVDSWRCNGLWWDMSCVDTTVVNNVIDGAESYGIEVEVSARCVVAGNWIYGRGGRTKYGIALYNTGGDKNGTGFARVYNNWIEECSGWDGPMVMDNRRQNVAGDVCDFRARNIEHCNNVHAKRSTMYRLYAIGNGTDVYADTAVTKMYANVITSSDTGGTMSSRLAGWTNASQTRVDYQTVAALQSAKPQVQRTILTSIVSPSAGDLDGWKSAAEPLPQDVADALGLPLGTKVLGPPLAQPIRMVNGGGSGGSGGGVYLPAPSPLTASLSGTTLSISWGAVAGAVGYFWEYKAAASATWNEMAVTTSLTQTVTGLTAGIPYDVRVSALNTNYEPGDPATVTTA